MSVRLARPADAPAIARVHVDGWQVGYAGLIDRERLEGVTLERREGQWSERLAGGVGEARTLVAEAGGSVGGFCTVAVPARDAEEAEDVGEIPALYVAPRMWGTGVGSTLMNAALEEMRGAGCREAVLWMLQGNDRAERFYERRGWRHDGGRRESQYFPDADYMVEVRFRLAL